VLAIRFEDDRDLEQVASEVIFVRKCPMFSPYHHRPAAALYYVAKRKGCSIDKPRTWPKRNGG
jgi:hypothetical protein